jgi:hypothetical protein
MNTWPGAFDPDTSYRGDAPGSMPKISGGAINLIVTDPTFVINFKAQWEGRHFLRFEVVF